jgi:hypothetical protein
MHTAVATAGHEAADMHANDATAWLWKAVVLAVCIAIATAAKGFFQLVRATLVLRRQFRGPPSSSLLMGELKRSVGNYAKIIKHCPCCLMRCSWFTSKQQGGWHAFGD